MEPGSIAQDLPRNAEVSLREVNCKRRLRKMEGVLEEHCRVACDGERVSCSGRRGEEEENALPVKISYKLADSVLPMTRWVAVPLTLRPFCSYRHSAENRNTVRGTNAPQSRPAFPSWPCPPHNDPMPRITLEAWGTPLQCLLRFHPSPSAKKPAS